MPCSNKHFFGHGRQLTAGSSGIGLAALLLVILFLIADTKTDAAKYIRPDLTPEEVKRVIEVTTPTTDFSVPESFESMAGGATTSRAGVSRNSFSHASANLDFAGEQNFKLGNALFRKLWVAAPASTHASDGLGPLYNARSCQRCHLKDGRGHPPQGLDDLATSMILKFVGSARSGEEKVNTVSENFLNNGDPVYGKQLQDFAIPGLLAEGRLQVSYEEIAIALTGGEQALLRKPVYDIADLAYGPLDSQTTLSPRVAPPMIGLGLLEAIHPNDIINSADPEDIDGDNISGRANLVRDPVSGNLFLGRFGWQASVQSLRSQTAIAFAMDIGISSPENPKHYGDCTEQQNICNMAETGVQVHLGATEAPPPVVDLVTFYSGNLAVPARRDIDDRVVLQGKEIFYNVGCISCHRPKYVTARDASIPEHRFQLIWPYSDLLLHDMGDGLADRGANGEVIGREWRTPPLWGIGLTESVSGHTYFLHDGRARSLLEAVLWHGGEAQAARDSVIALDPDNRQALLRFLESL